MATNWNNYLGTCDYFNTCATNPDGHVPKNFAGHQNAYNGNAYGSILTYEESGGNWREVIGVQLLNPLIVSQKYFVSFRLSRADDIFLTGYSTNKMGAKLSVNYNQAIIDNNPKCYTSTVISDTLNWTKVVGSFIADSAYQHLMIGNFFDDASTTILHDGTGSAAYYFIDDVCLTTDSVFAADYGTSIDEYDFEKLIEIYPNPANNYIKIKSNNLQQLKILNSVGQYVQFVLDVKDQESIINCSLWPNGIYLLGTKNRKYRILVNH
jgi:hypothetical protein